MLILSILVSTLHLQGKNPYSDLFVRGWYAGIDGGVNIVAAEDFKPYFPQSAINGSGVTSRFMAGYKFSPLFELRGLAGFSESRWYHKKNSNSFNTQYAALDFKARLGTNFFQYALIRNTDFSIFAGGGVLYRNKITPIIRENDDINLIIPVLRIGADVEYKLSEKLRLNLNGEFNFTDDKLNGYDAGKRSFDLLSCITIGLIFDFSPVMKGRWNY